MMNTPHPKRKGTASQKSKVFPQEHPNVFQFSGAGGRLWMFDRGPESNTHALF